MKVKKIIKTTEDCEIEITGATLLSAEEAKKLPLRLREYHNWWWLRSPGESWDVVTYVSIDGSVYDYGHSVNFDYDAVRPALLIDLKSSSLKIGDCFIFDDKEFEIISDTLAFCKSEIGEHCFRKALKTKNANDYERSDVKKFVDKWFEGVKNERQKRIQKSS